MPTTSPEEKKMKAVAMDNFPVDWPEDEHEQEQLYDRRRAEQEARIQAAEQEAIAATEKEELRKSSLEVLARIKAEQAAELASKETTTTTTTKSEAEPKQSFEVRLNDVKDDKDKNNANNVVVTAVNDDDNENIPKRSSGVHVIPSRTYKPYSTTYLETPLWSLTLEPLCFRCLEPILQKLYQLRNLLSPPMRVTVIPRILAGFLPKSAPGAFLTVGDLVLVTPLLVFFLRGIHYTFVTPSLDLSGYMAAYSLFFSYITASKSNSPFSFFLGIPYERLIGLHFCAAICAGILGGFHGYVAYNFGGDDDGDSKYSKAAEAVAAADETIDTTLTPNLSKFLFDGKTNWTGTILMASMVSIILLSMLSKLRRYFFNLWYVCHVVFGITVLVTLLLHSVRSAVLVTAWWTLDLLIRYAVLANSQNKTTAQLRLIGSRKRHERLPHEPAVEIQMQKPPGFHYNAGQFVRIAIPAISRVEFHPISITSAPHEEALTLHVRRLGDWSDQLVALAELTKTTTVLIEGPYGALSVGLEDDNQYKMVLCVSGGIGVTPCQSISKHLLHSHRTQGRNLKQLRFVWAVRDIGMARDIPPLLLEQEPNDDYSTSAPGFQRMLERSQSFHKSMSSSSRLLQKSLSFRKSSSRLSVRSLDVSISQRYEDALAASAAAAISPASPASPAQDSFRSLGNSQRSDRPLRRRPAIVQADIHCTRTPQEEQEYDTEEGAVNANASTSHFPYNLHSGRPDLDKIFEEMKEDALSLGERNVAVIGCGPPSLMVALEEACRKHSASIVGCCQNDGGVFFDLHKEHFEL